MAIQLPVRIIIEEASLKVHERLREKRIEGKRIFLPAPCISYLVTIELENQLIEKKAKGTGIFEELKEFLYVKYCEGEYKRWGLKVSRRSISGRNVIGEYIVNIIRNTVAETLENYINLMSIPTKAEPQIEDILKFYYFNAPIIGMELLQAMVVIESSHNTTKEGGKQ